MILNAGDIQDQLVADGLPVVKDTVRTQPDGTWTAEFSAPLTGEEITLKRSVVSRLTEQRRRGQIKAKAGEIILKEYPLWQQVNDERRLRVLKDKWVLSQLTTDKAEIDRLERWFKWVDDVRTEADRLEQDASATPNWPEPPTDEGEG